MPTEESTASTRRASGNFSSIAVPLAFAAVCTVLSLVWWGTHIDRKEAHGNDRDADDASRVGKHTNRPELSDDPLFQPFDHTRKFD